MDETTDITPSPIGFAQIGARFANQIIEDIRKARKEPDTALLVELVKIASHLTRTGNDRLLAALIVSIEQGGDPITYVPSADASPATGPSFSSVTEGV